MAVSKTSSKSSSKPRSAPSKSSASTKSSSSKKSSTTKSTTATKTEKASQSTGSTAKQERTKVDQKVQTDTRQRVAAQEKQRAADTQRVSETKATAPKRGLSTEGAPSAPAKSGVDKATETAKAPPAVGSKASQESSNTVQQERAKVDQQVQTETRERVAAQEKQRVAETQQVNETKPAPTTMTPKAGLSDPAPASPPQSPVEKAAETARQTELAQNDAEKRAAAAKEKLTAAETEVANANQSSAEAYESAAEKAAAQEAGYPGAPTPQETTSAWNAAHATTDKVKAAEQKREVAKTESQRADAEVARLKVASEKAQATLSQETAAATEKAMTTADQTERQAIVDQLSRAGETAGVQGAKTMGEAAANVIGTRPSVAISSALQTSVETGNGALFGTRTAESLLSKKGAAGMNGGDVARSVAAGINNVQNTFTAAQEKAGVQQARFANFMATHGKSLSPEQRTQAQKDFNATAAKEYAAYNEASKNLISVAQGADAAREKGNERLNTIMSSRADLKAVREQVPGALMSEAGQAHLKDTLKTTPAGELPSYLVARNDAEAARLAGPLASAVVGTPEAAGRTEMLADVAKHGEQLGMPELGDKALLSQYEQVANGTNVAGIKDAISAIQLGLKAADKPSLPAAGKFGAFIGLGSAVTNLADSKDAKSVVEASTKLGHAGAEFFEAIGKNPAVASRVADVLGKGAAGFDTLNAINSIAKGKYAEGAFSLASATGAVLSFAGKRVAGGWVGAAATVGEIGYNVYKSVKERNAYEAQATQTFKNMGFSNEAAAILGGLHGDTSANLSKYGQGLGPGGRDLSAAEVLMHAKNLSPEQIQRLVSPPPVYDTPYGVPWGEFVR